MKATKAVRKPTAGSTRHTLAAGEPKRTVIIIEAKVNVGFGNNLFVRGQGPGLSWEAGVPLKCIDSETWQWSTPASNELKFKLLLNDTVWAQGEDLVATPGQRLRIAPRF